jgi:hypothetical protein
MITCSGVIVVVILLGGDKVNIALLIRCVVDAIY